MHLSDAVIALSLAGYASAWSPLSLFTRAPGWASGNPNDQIALYSSDEKVDYGNMNPGDITDSFRRECKSGVCKASWTLDTNWRYEAGKGSAVDRVEHGKLQISVDDQVLHEDHVEYVALAFQILMDRLKTTERKPLTFAGPKGCFGKMCKRDNVVENGHIMNHVGPSAVKIEIREKPTEGKRLSDMPVIVSVRMNMAVQRGGAGAGLCGAFAGIGSAIAGGINPTFGSVFSLSALACL